MKPIIWAALALLLTSANAWALDLCFYVDADGAVLRTNETSTELTLESGAITHCAIVPAHAPATVETGSCEDQPGLVFPVFTGASDPALRQDDLLIFRNAVWYRKCAFNR